MKNYRIKTRSKYKKCFKILGSGKIKRKRTGGNHFLLKKSGSVKRKIAKGCIVSNTMFKTIMKRIA